MLTAARSMADLPAVMTALSNLTRDPVARTRLVDAAWKLLLLIGLGLLAEAVIARAVRAPRRRLDALAPAPDAKWRRLRQLPLVVGRLLLDLLPIAGFGLAVYGLFGLVHPLPTTQLVGLLLAHTYMAARAAFVVARLLFAPGTERLRLLPAPTRRRPPASTGCSGCCWSASAASPWPRPGCCSACPGRPTTPSSTWRCC
ncbi:hypothetical protein ACFQU2_19410 [Siccirubricoccus deserti]